MRIRIRFTTRQLLIAVVVAGIGFSVVAKARIHTAHEQGAVDHIVRAGGEVISIRNARNGILSWPLRFWDYLTRGVPSDRFAVVHFTQGRLTDERLEALNSLGVNLSLSLTNTDAADLSRLSACRSLTQIVIDACPPPDDRVGAIPPLGTLHSVIIRNGTISAQNVNDLAGCPELSQLMLLYCKANGTERLDFASMTKLRDLRIYGNPHETADLVKALGQCRGLEHLALRHLDLTMDDARHIAEIGSIRSLDLIGTTILDGDMTVFCRTNLRNLYVAEGQLTAMELTKFEQRLPQCSIDRIQGYEMVRKEVSGKAAVKTD